MKNPVVEWAQAVLDSAKLVEKADSARQAVAEAEERVSKARGEADACKAQCAALVVEAEQRAASIGDRAQRQAVEVVNNATALAENIHQSADKYAQEAALKILEQEKALDALASECATLRQTVAALEDRKAALQDAVARLKQSISNV